MINKKRIIVSLSLAILFIVIAYFALSPIVLSGLILFLPQKTASYSNIPRQVFGATASMVTFKTSSGRTLYGVYFNKPNSTYTVLLHHGQGGNLGVHIGLAKTMLLAGLSVLTYDYEGFGMSEGSPSIKNLLSDGEAAYDYLVQTQHVDPHTIINCGFSLGTGVASYIAMKRICAGVILISPYTSIHRLGSEIFPFFRLYPQCLFPHPDMGSLDFILSNRTTPVLLIHGKNDGLISAHHSEDLNTIARCPHWLVIDAKVHHGDYSTVFLAQQIRDFCQHLIIAQNRSKK